jgi:acyl-coenzyme A synthetase/AMP-(fatty) acid ligase
LYDFNFCNALQIMQVNVPSGKSVSFKEARDKSRKVASALTKMGFEKGDILYFVTTECVDLYLVQLAVWMLGGAVRGASALETKGMKTTFISVLILK